MGRGECRQGGEIDNQGQTGGQAGHVNQSIAHRPCTHRWSMLHRGVDSGVYQGFVGTKGWWGSARCSGNYLDPI